MTAQEMDDYDRQRLPIAYAGAVYHAERHRRRAREAVALGATDDAEKLLWFARNCDDYARELDARGRELGLALGVTLAAAAQGELWPAWRR